MYYQGMKKVIVQRPVNKNINKLEGLHPLLARVFAARGVASAEGLDRSLGRLPSPWLLSGMEAMVDELVAVIKSDQKICVVADFDADGATSCALAIKGLQLLGARRLDFVVPNRFEYGYGLTPEIVELVQRQQPDVILTVDNGISSIDGIEAANQAGIKVLVTDHHLPGQTLPHAAAIVNPNLPDDRFPGKSLAGVGVMFYVLMALRRRLREKNWFQDNKLPEPNLGQLLDYVALGTVADVVSLDQVNRILVYQGLVRIRMGKAAVGIQALIEVARKKAKNLSATDLGFALGPRLNAAGRMDDMALGIHCLLVDDPALAKTMAMQLDDLNTDRREIEGQMQREAMALLAEMNALHTAHLPAGVCLFDKEWHQGVIGILAARVKDQLHRPVIAFAPAGDGIIKGSARSIPGVHIRDVLSDIAATHPKLLNKFGGHAMAAGLSLTLRDYPAFALAFDEMVGKHLAGVDLEQKIWSDGELAEEELNLSVAELLQHVAVWGQGFPEPVFHGRFEVIQSRIVGQRHLKLVLRQPGGQQLLDAMVFFIDQPERWLGIREIVAAYRLDINEYRGARGIQLIVNYLEKTA